MKNRRHTPEQAIRLLAQGRQALGPKARPSRRSPGISRSPSRPSIVGATSTAASRSSSVRTPTMPDDRNQGREVDAAKINAALNAAKPTGNTATCSFSRAARPRIASNSKTELGIRKCAYFSRAACICSVPYAISGIACSDGTYRLRSRRSHIHDDHVRLGAPRTWFHPGVRHLVVLCRAPTDFCPGHGPLASLRRFGPLLRYVATWERHSRMRMLHSDRTVLPFRSVVGPVAVNPLRYIGASKEIRLEGPGPWCHEPALRAKLASSQSKRSGSSQNGM